MQPDDTGNPSARKTTDMFRSLFKIRNARERSVVDHVYRQIVAASRQPVFYSEWDVADTPLGRFEMISLHLFLFLHRIRGGNDALKRTAQDVTDTFFTDVDHSLRELGIGDMGVPKRMKKLAQMFYGRADAYGKAIDAEDAVSLEAALCRNVMPEAKSWPAAKELSDYVISANRQLAALDEQTLLTGEIRFPQPGRNSQSEDQ